MGNIERRAIALGITEQAVDALVRDQHRPLLERVCDFAGGVLANNQEGAVERADDIRWAADFLDRELDTETAHARAARLRALADRLGGQ